jgi:hypothetical protein
VLGAWGNPYTDISTLVGCRQDRPAYGPCERAASRKVALEERLAGGGIVKTCGSASHRRLTSPDHGMFDGADFQTGFVGGHMWTGEELTKKMFPGPVSSAECDTAFVGLERRSLRRSSTTGAAIRTFSASSGLTPVDHSHTHIGVVEHERPGHAGPPDSLDAHRNVYCRHAAE